MRIEYTVSHSTRTEVDDVEEYVANSIYDWEEGHVERAHANAEKAQKALGRLIDVLCEKGLLSAKEVVAIAETFDKEPKLIK